MTLITDGVVRRQNRSECLVHNGARHYKNHKGEAASAVRICVHGGSMNILTFLQPASPFQQVFHDPQSAAIMVSSQDDLMVNGIMQEICTGSL